MVNNIITKVFFNRSYSYDNPEYTEIVESIERQIALINPASLHWQLPMWIGKHLPKAKQMMDVRRHFIDMVTKFAYERKAVVEDGQSNPQCIADALWHKILFDKDTAFQESVIGSYLADAFAAGQETIITTMAWIILTLLHNPHVVENMQEELDREFPDEDSLIPYSASTVCHYTLATISEVQRRTPVLFSTLDHTAMEDVEDFHGFRIPKGTRMFANLIDLNYDKKVWKYPESFKPDNFLDEEGRYQSNPNLLTFSMGARKCPGDALARMELFVITANLFKRFKISAVDGSLPKLHTVFNFTLSPPPFEVVVHKR